MSGSMDNMATMFRERKFKGSLPVEMGLEEVL
jgi:hypothetical protein